jgi:putative transposase
MKYNPKIHHRRSIRLPNYDYSREGAYFITICTHHRDPLFGEIVHGEMQLSNLGKIARWHWQNLIKHYSYLQLDEFIIMPDHLHGILILDGTGCGAIDGRSSPVVGAGLCDMSRGIDRLSSKPAPTGGYVGNPESSDDAIFDKPAPTGGCVGNPESSDDAIFDKPVPTGGYVGNPESSDDAIFDKPAPTGGYVGNPESSDVGTLFAGQRKGIPEIIRGYKTFSARQINRARRGAKIPVWQRNYYERIIRDERELHNVRQYIINNPKKSHPSPSPENIDEPP